MKRKVRIGFIGCGGISRGHMQRVVGSGMAEIVALCDVDEARMTEPAEQFKAHMFADYREMLAGVELDAVYLCLPPFAHGDVEAEVVKRGIPFFVEKPVALDMETARRIDKAVKARRLLTCVGYQLRYTGAASAARKLLARRRVGMVVARYWCGIGQTSTKWLIKMDFSGGQLVEQATHTIDLIRYLCGDITEVYAMQAKELASKGDCPDVNCVLMRLAGGGAVTLTASWGTGDPADWSQANQIQIFFGKHRMDLDASQAVITPQIKSFKLPKRPLPDIDAVFAKAVATGDRKLILTSYSEGVKSLAVSIAANESARTGKPVKLA